MKAVVLAGGQEFGQCPLSRQAPRALWPLVDKPIIEHVLRALQERAGINEVIISANGRTHDIADRIGEKPFDGIDVRYSEDCLPRGAAGCIKDCQKYLGNETFIVAPGASLLINIDFDHLLAEHRRSGAVITVGAAADPGDSVIDGNLTLSLKPTGLYVCEPEVFEHIRTRGYQDMKEQLIPRLVQAGLKVRAVPLRGRVIPVRNEECYINAMVALMEDVDNREAFTRHLPAKHPAIWIDPTAYVHPQARIVGPAYVGPNAKIMGDAVVIGPAIVSADCAVDGDAIVHESILWRGAKVGAGAMVEQTVMAADAVVPAAGEVRGSIVIETSLSAAERQSLSRSLDLDPTPRVGPVRRLLRRLSGALRPAAAATAAATSRHANVARA